MECRKRNNLQPPGGLENILSLNPLQEGAQLLRSNTPTDHHHHSRDFSAVWGRVFALSCPYNCHKELLSLFCVVGVLTDLPGILNL